jgi:glucose/arabinose dehydrogenase
MSRTRVLFVVLLALTLAGGMLGTSLRVLAQEATPVVELSVTPPAQPGGTLPGNPQIQLVKVAGGLADPVNVAAPNDGSGRLFVVERVGRIRIIDQDGNLLPEPFLDLTELVQNDYLEQGLLGLAFHPDYATNGRFFVHFTDYHTNGDNFIMEFPVTDDPNLANREGSWPSTSPTSTTMVAPSTSARMATSTSASATVVWAVTPTTPHRTARSCSASCSG